MGREGGERRGNEKEKREEGKGREGKGREEVPIGGEHQGENNHLKLRENRQRIP